MATVVAVLRSRKYTQPLWPGLRLVATDVNTTLDPSAEIRASPLPPLPSVPALDTLTNDVVGGCAHRSRTKTSFLTLVSPATRFVESEAKTTRQPSSEMLADSWKPLPPPPVVLTLMSSVVPATRSRR